MKKPLRLLALVLFSLVLVPLAGFAAEEPPGVAAYFDAVTRQPGSGGVSRPTYGSIEHNGNGGAVLLDVQWSATSPKMEVSFSADKMVFAGVSQRASGSYSFESVLTENFVMKIDKLEGGPVVIAIPKIPATNVHILPKTSADGIDYSPFLGSMVYRGQIPTVLISAAGQTFEAKNLSIDWNGDPETGFGKWDVSLQSVIIPVDAIPNAGFQKDMKEQLGFEQFDLAFDASVSMTQENQKVNAAYGFRMTGKQIGDFEFAIAAKDIPAQLGTVLKQVQSGGKPNMGQIMPLVIGVKFVKLKLRFVDNNFTKKMLALAAKKQGTTVEAMTSNGAALIQVSLMQLNLPEFSKTVLDAYKAFVNNPQNISIEASPETPVAIATLMGLIAAPAVAIKTLGVKVEANR